MNGVLSRCALENNTAGPRFPLGSKTGPRACGLRLAAVVASVVLLHACGSGGGGDDDPDEPPSPPPPAPQELALSFSASPAIAEYGVAVKLSWTATNATSCVASNGWSGEKIVQSGQELTPPLTASALFTLSCRGETGSVTKSVEVVIPPLPPDPGSAGTTTVAGVDSNANGLRDDVEIYLLTTYPAGNERTTLLGRAEQLQVALNEPAEAVDVFEDLFENLQCLYLSNREQAREHSARLLAKFVNTASRSAAYLAFATNAGGATMEMLTPAELQQECLAGAP